MIPAESGLGLIFSVVGSSPLVVAFLLVHGGPGGGRHDLCPAFREPGPPDSRNST
jgi:hypothetical protein